MAACRSWHCDLSSLPNFSGEAVDNFVKLQCVAQETSVRGYKFFKEHFIHDFEVCNRSSACGADPFSVRAKCYRSMRKNSAPHRVQLDLNDMAEVKSWSCSCAAGAALCHHAVGLLYQLQDFQRRGLKAVPVIESKTSAPQTWHVPPRTGSIQPRKVSDVIIQKPKKPTALPPTKCRRLGMEGIQSTLFSPLQAELHTVNLAPMMCPYFESLTWKDRPQFSQLWLPNNDVPLVESKLGLVPRGSVISYQQAIDPSARGDIILDADILTPPPFVFPDWSSEVSKYQPLSPELEAKYNGLCVTLEQAVDYEEQTRDQSGNENWFKLRANRITASNFKRICSRRGNNDKLAIELRKSRNVQTAAMKHGIDNEPVAAEQYVHVFDRSVFKVGFVINPSCYFLGCSPDRRVFDPCETNCPWGLLEIKCTRSVCVAELKYLDAVHTVDGNEVLRLKRTHDYYYQVMGQLAITGSAWCDFFVLATNDHHVERIRADDVFWAQNMVKLTAFFFEYFLCLN